MPLVLEKKRSMRNFFSDCAGSGVGSGIESGIKMVAPLKLPIQWTRVLRFEKPRSMKVEEFLQVGFLTVLAFSKTE